MNDPVEALDGFQNLRKPHLQRLLPIEEMIRKLAPLPISYDVGRIQSPHFHEFTYTEMLGGVVVSPQSSEVATRLACEHCVKEESFDINAMLDARLRATGTLDKYELQEPISLPEATKIIFTPGSNLFLRLVSKELLFRAMDDKDVIIKTHPLTNDDNFRMLGREFGYHRIAKPMESGWHYLSQATEVYCTTATEMGLYAVLNNIPIFNIGNYFTEAGGTFYPFYRGLWSMAIEARHKTLLQRLCSSTSGWLHPDDPQTEAKARIFFKTAMDYRELFRPRAVELTAVQHQDALCAMHPPTEK